MAQIRRVLECEACGGPVSLYDTECAYCGSEFEQEDDKVLRLPSSRKNPHAQKDAKRLQPGIDRFLRMDHLYPDEIDFIHEALMDVRDHEYKFRYFILELIMDLSHYRSICLDNKKERRVLHLEILKKMEAIYNSLTK